ncbi:MAG: FKBP-type peptidyl-prolyl cis-trans isomerase [Cyclobacteriaceae bacterium]|jgi:FKBP-type peptidyl-prolyl cis-trans isomerase FkpA|nr:FKBP-type peptidyl-prolyl cis-trans isomerase [Cyclobacteriaceae bacterium]
MKTRLIKISYLIFLVATVLVSCSDDELSSEEQFNLDVALIDEYISVNNLQNVKTTPSGLRYISNSIGNGEFHAQGEYAVVHYEGKRTDGTIFDTSLDGDPFTFQVATGSVIAGFDEGVRNINIEASGTIIIPSYLGYGSGGSGSIKANEVLVFDIEVLSEMQILLLDLEKMDEYLSTSSLSNILDTQSGILYEITTAGAGDNVKTGDEVSINYKGYLLNGVVFDQNTTGTFDYTVGTDGLIEGWVEAVSLLNKGAKGTFVIPSTLCYGRTGFNTIPPNTVLIFDIEIIDIK